MKSGLGLSGLSHLPTPFRGGRSGRGTPAAAAAAPGAGREGIDMLAERDIWERRDSEKESIILNTEKNQESNV